MREGLILFPKSTLAGGSNAFDWWKTEAKVVGINLCVAFFEDITLEYGEDCRAWLEDKPLRMPDFVIMRGYSAEISLFFEERGCPVFNRWEAMATSHNKALTHMRLSAAGIPSPRAFLRSGGMDYAEACRLAQSNVFVAKQPDSSRGMNVFLVHNESEYAHALSKCGGSMLVQQYVASSHGRDLRVWTVGKRAVAQVLRHSDTSFLSNFSQGGRSDTAELSQEAAELAVKAAGAVGLDFAGVDLLFLPNGGFTVCEVNGNAGFRTLSATGGTNIVRIFLEYIRTKVYGN